MGKGRNAAGGILLYPLWERKLTQYLRRGPSTRAKTHGNLCGLFCVLKTRGRYASLFNLSNTQGPDAAVRASYSSLEQGHGSSTARNGSPAAAACASTNVRRTACMATRSATWLKVVSRPAISAPMAPDCRAWLRIRCKAQALSLPLDQESSARFKLLFKRWQEHARRCAACGSATRASRTGRRSRPDRRPACAQRTEWPA